MLEDRIALEVSSEFTFDLGATSFALVQARLPPLFTSYFFSCFGLTPGQLISSGLLKGIVKIRSLDIF
jgi:hypothetical protein